MVKLCKHVPVLLLLGIIAVYTACAGRSIGGAPSERSSRNYYRAPAAVEESRREAAGGMRRYSGTADRDSAAMDDAPATEKKNEAQQRMVIYDGKYRIIVESVKNTVKDVEGIVERYNGFLQAVNTSDSYRRATIILRIPVDSFDAATKDVEKLGTVLHKEVSASDVTMQFHDVSLRLKTAEKVRERLYQLLKRVDKVKERVKVLREIARLNTTIDSFTAQINYLRDRATLSTIALDLEAIVRDTARQYISSPFKWIAQLSPGQRSIFDIDAGIYYAAPKGFFMLKDEFFDRRGQYLFQNPSRTVSMRIGTVENYPPADRKFWNEAFAIDLENRKYKVAERHAVEGKKGLKFDAYRIRLSDSSSYIAAFGMADKQIIIFEARIDNDELYKNNREAIDKFLSTVGYEK
jgi:hypothetical protein